MCSYMIKISRGLCVLLLAFGLSACADRISLFEALTQEEANEIYSSLLEVGIPAEKGSNKQGSFISVPKQLSSDALRILEKKGLPRDKKTSIGEVFKKESMISSPLEERARYLFALSQELEQTLMRMDGVLSARVHIVLPERSNPGEPLTPSSAAVFVKYADGASFPAYITRVRELIFKSIPGLSGDPATSVTVAAVPSENTKSLCLPLLWYGPMALHPDDKVYFLSLMYLFFIMWGLSLGIVWLQAKDIADWPESLAKLRSRFMK
jgi:type III secretion protein J